MTVVAIGVVYFDVVGIWGDRLIIVCDGGRWIRMVGNRLGEEIDKKFPE